MLRSLRERKPDLRAKGVVVLWVFGSVARGDTTPDSDIDLLIDFAPEAKPSLLTLSGLQLDLAGALGRPVEVGERRALTPRVAEAVKHEMVRVY